MVETVHRTISSYCV